MYLQLLAASFYKLLFFKQLQGFQQQALADAVVAYALNIDNLGALEGAVKQVTEHSWVRSVIFASKDQDLLIDLDLLCDLDHCG